MLPADHRDRLRLVLVATRNPLNVGVAARAMSNFGFQHLRLVRPFERAFREARSAVGAAHILAAAQEFATVAEAVADSAFVVGTADPRRSPPQPSLSLPQAAPLIRERLRSQPVALLFGSEKRGLSNLDLSHCHLLVHIPTLPDQPSMNLGHAVAVCLYELARDREVSPLDTPAPESATAHDEERLTTLLVDVLRRTRYITPGADAHAEERTRALLRRMHLSAADARICLGMLRRIKWKLVNPEKPPRPSQEPR
jgi:TrmH family RNA methyltransferase